MAASCPFCEIASGARAAIVVHQTARFICFARLEPEAPGHTVIATRQHYTCLLDAPPEIGTELVEVCQYLGRNLDHCDTSHAFNLLAANGAEAQQSVMHLHLHFIPRRRGDGLDAWPPLARKPARG